MRLQLDNVRIGRSYHFQYEHHQGRRGEIRAQAAYLHAFAGRSYVLAEGRLSVFLIAHQVTAKLSLNPKLIFEGISVDIRASVSCFLRCI